MPREIAAGEAAGPDPSPDPGGGASIEGGGGGRHRPLLPFERQFPALGGWTTGGGGALFGPIQRGSPQPSPGCRPGLSAGLHRLPS